MQSKNQFQELLQISADDPVIKKHGYKNGSDNIKAQCSVILTVQKQKGEKAGPDPVAEILQSYRQTPVRHQRPEQPDEIVHHHKNRAH